MKRYVTNSAAQTQQLGETIGKSLPKGAVVALYGGLGMGKTTFVRGLARGLGLEDTVSSPTFALVHEYRGENTLYHFDMYRVSGCDDLYSTGFFDYLDGEARLVCEWSENIEEFLPAGALKIAFAPGEQEEQRIITVGGDPA